VPRPNSDVMMHSSEETHVKSIECDPIVETAHVKRCVAGYPVRYGECTMGDPGIGCPLIEQRPQSTELGDRGGEAVEPDNGPELDSVIEQPRQSCVSSSKKRFWLDLPLNDSSADLVENFD